MVMFIVSLMAHGFQWINEFLNPPPMESHWNHFKESPNLVYNIQFAMTESALTGFYCLYCKIVIVILYNQNSVTKTIVVYRC